MSHTIDTVDDPCDDISDNIHEWIRTLTPETEET